MLMPQPSMSPIPERGLWYNNEDFEINIRGHKIVVPGFFCIDGASIPKFLWALYYHPFDALVILAALVHDWLYWSHQVPKEEADLIFKELLILNGVPEDTAHQMYVAVSLFGNLSWSLKEEEKPLLLMLYILVKDSPRFNEYHFPIGVLNITVFP